MYRCLTIAAVSLALTAAVYALGPHEVAVIVNRNSADSRELAHIYADLRGIPAINIIELDLPDLYRNSEHRISPDEFRELIYNPVRDELGKRRLSSHILAWAYSVDFPVAVSSDPAMSLLGITFTRGEVPEAESIRKGTWASPLFRGPDKADGPAAASASLEQFTLLLEDNMPLPSMMLGYTGARGLTLDECVRVLQLGAAADASSPRGTIYFIEGDGVRAKARNWQYKRVVDSLAEQSVAAILDNTPPSRAGGIMGIFMGAAAVQPGSYGTFTPGAIGDHLTSFAALFKEPSQSKLTSWLRAGTIASAGTIDEPYAIWTKFPHARLFDHYARGCTVLEAYFQAVRCPLQLMIVGDPLCRPWAEPPGITLVSMADDEEAPIEGQATYLASVWAGMAQNAASLLYLLDGRSLNHPGNKADFSFDSRQLHDGYHTLRAVAYANRQVRHQAFDEVGFEVRNRGRRVRILEPETESAFRTGEPIPVVVKVEADEKPVEVAIISLETVIARASEGESNRLILPAGSLGPGPVSIQAVAVFDDKMPVRSPPVDLQIEYRNEAPALNIAAEPGRDGMIRLRPSATDADGDDLSIGWLVRAPLAMSGSKEPGVSTADKTFRITAGQAETSTPVVAIASLERPDRMERLVISLSATFEHVHGPDARLGMVFDHTEDGYAYVYYDARRDAWVGGQVRDGDRKELAVRGFSMGRRENFRLDLSSRSDRTTRVRLNGRHLFDLPVPLGPGQPGLYAEKVPEAQAEILAGPASVRLIQESKADTTLTIPLEKLDTLNPQAYADDGRELTVTPYVPDDGLDQ